MAVSEKRKLEIAKAQRLSAAFGFADPFDLVEHYITDSICPAICMSPDCDYTAELEPDQKHGYCEECGKKTMQSAFVILGII